jgi:hypothetical protein
VYIPAPSGSAAADAGVQLACQLAEQYTHSHPQQPLLVSALFAQHYAREGAAALQQAGELAQQQDIINAALQPHAVWQHVCCSGLPAPLPLKKKRGYNGVFKRLRRNGHLECQKAANSSAQTVTLEAQPQEKPLYVRHDIGFACKTVFLNIRCH